MQAHSKGEQDYVEERNRAQLRTAAKTEKVPPGTALKLDISLKHVSPLLQ